MSIAGKRAIIGVGGIPEIQAFSVSFAGATSTAATISPVDTSRSVIVMAGISASGTDACMPLRAELTNATTVTVTRTRSTGTTTVLKGFVLTYPVGIIKSIQRGTISMTSGETSKAATVTSVNTAKSILNHLGNTTNESSSPSLYAPSESTLTLTNATTVTADRGSVTGTAGALTNVTSYELIEFN